MKKSKVHTKNKDGYWLMTVDDILFYGWTISVVNFIVILPLTFNLYIIPKIEQRIGKKLQFNAVMYKVQIFSKWFYPPLEIGLDIVIKYLIWKITGNLPGDRWGYNPKDPSPLRQVHYDISQAPCFEIIMGFVAVLDTLLFIFTLLVIWLQPG
jgi:hypothetical protein